MNKYNTLLVIDNLETINSADVKPLFENLPRGTKVLITSRIGLGDYESRSKLERLSEKDALLYFRKLISSYSVNPLRKNR